MSRQRLITPYIYSVIAAGAIVYLYSAATLPLGRVDIPYLLLAFFTVVITSRISIQIPRVTSCITVSDTLVFLTIILYGGPHAVLIAGAEGFCSAARISKKPRTLLFNGSQLTLATFFTAAILKQAFGNGVDLGRQGLSASFLASLVVMALVQYIANSGLAAIYEAIRTDKKIIQTWVKHYLWTSMTYVVGACAAGIAVVLIQMVGFYSFLIVTPIIGVIYFTYRTYLQNVKTAEAQAEQAKRHVEELSHYIAEQERIREQFSQVEKMSALGELASGVAHDFNNTLAAILGRAELMMKRTDDAKMRRGLEIIVKSAQDGAKTVKRIQDFARQRRDHDFKPISVDQILLDVSEITRPRWKDKAEASNIYITFALDNHSGAMVMGEASELRDVMVNMIFNAVDAMPAGGCLTLAAEQAGEEVVISLSDTGTGMSPEVRSRVFDPFFTTKGVEGMGLGLAVGYGIIRRHEGTIEVESEVGHGTTFHIKLKAAQGAAETASPDLSIAGKRSKRLKMTKILVVDDEDRVRELLQEILEDDGYEVTVASGGREGLALFESQSFDAVFTDVGMPGMSGWELARAIRERNRHIPLAVITGWGEIVSTTDREAAGVNWVLTKPFSVAQIAGIAEEISRHRNPDSLSASPAVPELVMVA